MNTQRPLIRTTAFALLSIRRLIAVACVLAILAQTLVMAVSVSTEHHHDAGHQQMLDLSHAVDETSQDCHNGSHCHGCAPVFGLSAVIATVLLESQHAFIAIYSNTAPRYSPASPFRPPIV
jgi:hypothetical protein